MDGTWYRVYNTETQQIEDGSPVIGAAAAWITSIYFGWKGKESPYFRKIRLEEVCPNHLDIRKIDCTECKKKEAV